MKVFRRVATTDNLFHLPACLPRSSSSAHLWWKWEAEIGFWRSSCRLLQVIALRKQRWHGKRRGKTREQVSPLKSLPVRWRRDSVKHGPCWLPFLTEKKPHSTILLTRCLVFLSLKLAGWRLFCVFRQKGMTSLTDMHMQVPPTHPCSQWRRYSMPLRSIWLAAISITLMMKAMAKAQIRLLRTHVCRFFFVGWTGIITKRILRQLSLMSQQNSQDGHKCNYILLFQVIVVSITRIMTGLGKW